jgi:Icc-related predicted phosphoesterase
MREIVSISDTHTQHEALTDYLNLIYTRNNETIIVHSGDISYRGKLPEVLNFFRWFSNLPFSHKIMISGNHDFIFEKQGLLIKDILKSEFPNIIYLQDSGVEIKGLKFWGSPVTPRFFDWAFNRDEDIQNHWDLIPEDTDVLITHGPPYGILDQTHSGLRVGCPRLIKKIKELKNLKLHIFGHIHEASGTETFDSVQFINASTLNLNYEVENYPFSIKL